jgi:hypothetical protein
MEYQCHCLTKHQLFGRAQRRCHPAARLKAAPVLRIDNGSAPDASPQRNGRKFYLIVMVIFFETSGGLNG